MADDLKTIVQRMIDAGESEENIQTVIQHFKAQQPAPTPVAQAPATKTPNHGGLPDWVFPDTPERINGAVKLLGYAQGPTQAIVDAIPNAARATQGFEAVKQAAQNVPVNMNAPGQAGLRIMQLADRGGTAPRAVTQLMRRATDPTQGPILYPEARDFASNISRLSADEYGRLTPVIQREMGNLRTTLNSAIGDAADTVGQGDTYRSAMKEYAQAAQLKSYKDALIAALQKGLPYGLGGGITGAAGYGAYRAAKALFGE